MIQGSPTAITSSAVLMSKNENAGFNDKQSSFEGNVSIKNRPKELSEYESFQKQIKHSSSRNEFSGENRSRGINGNSIALGVGQSGEFNQQRDQQQSSFSRNQNDTQRLQRGSGRGGRRGGRPGRGAIRAWWWPSNT